MNKVNVIINNQRKTIGIDLIGSINNVESIIQTIHDQIKNIDIKSIEINITDWKINIFTQHARIYSHETEYLLNILKHCNEYNAKQLDIIVAKPQKALKENIANLLQKNNIEVKLLSSNKIH